MNHLERWRKWVPIYRAQIHRSRVQLHVYVLILQENTIMYNRENFGKNCYLLWIEIKSYIANIFEFRMIGCLRFVC